jgi:hypothetical protein
MIEIVLESQKLRGSIGLLIEKSGYKNTFLAEKIGIPASNFSVKKQRASWTEHEIKAILQIIENEEIEDYYLKTKNLYLWKNLKDNLHESRVRQKVFERIKKASPKNQKISC